MKPTIGRIVHYFPLSFEKDGITQKAGNPAAAIIVFVHDDGTVNLQVFFTVSEGTAFYRHVPQGNRPCHWNWPKREEVA